MKESFILQDYVSRSDSIVAQISNHAANWGIGSFFSERIPFSGVTSKMIVVQLIDLITFFANENKQKPQLHLYEFGVGLGILAINILDTLADYFPHIYDKICYHVSDISKEKLTELKELDLFKKHINHVEFSILDLCDLKFKEDEPPLMVLHTYLLDALSARHIKVENNKIYEILIKTTIPTNFKLLDTNSFPPNYLNPDQIKKMIEESTNNKSKLILERRLKPFLQEEYKIIPLDKVKNITKSEKSAIKAFVKNKNINNETFNFSLQIKESTANIVEHLPMESCFCAIDFWHEEIKNEPNLDSAVKLLFTNYGVYQYYQVNEELVKFSANSINPTVLKNNKLHYTVAPNVLKNHNLYLVWNSEKEKEFNYLINKTFTQKDIEIFVRFTANIKNCTTKEEIFKEFNKIYPLTQQNHYLLINLAHQLLKNGYYEEAQKYASESLNYSAFLSTEAYNLLGDIELKKQNFDKSEYLYRKALSITPLLDGTYKKLAWVYNCKKNYSELLNTYKTWLEHTTLNNINELLLDIIKTTHKAGEHKLSEEIFSWLKNQD